MTAAVDGAGDVLQQNGFGGIVADSTRAAQKDHCGGNAGSENHGVVTGTTGHAMRSASGGMDGGFDVGEQEGVHCDSGMIQERRGVNGESAPGRDLLGQSNQPLRELRAHLVGLVADIEGEAYFAGNHICGARVGLNAADGGDKPSHTAGFGFDGHHPFGGGGQRVAAGVHGRGAGMIRMANESKRDAGLADNGLDRSESEIEAFENGPLLDVEFDIAEDIFAQTCGGKLGRIETKILDGLPDRNTVGIAAIKELLVAIADDGAASDEGRAEANPFFLGEGDDLDGEWQMPAVELFEQSDGYENTERTIEGTGVGNRVQVGAEQKPWRTGGGGWVEGTKIADGVQGCADTKRQQPFRNGLMAIAHGRGKKRSAKKRGVFTEARQGLTPGDDVGSAGGGGGIEGLRHRGHSRVTRASM